MSMSDNPADNFIAPKCHEIIQTVYEDDALLVINKPSGLLSLSGKHPQNLDSVHYRLVQEYPDCRLVHRLDLGTSGLLIVAKNKAINALLCRQFSEKRVQKHYVAVLAGHLDSQLDLIDAAIDKGVFPLMCVADSGKPAQTQVVNVQHIVGAQLNPEFKCFGVSDDTKLTLVEYLARHGRTHQLRIHSQHVGHPILGCDLYGTTQTHQQATRLMLHAHKLGFIHPISGQYMHIVKDHGFVLEP
ncbi:RluA family pseudouridine synthase [Paraferrimonas sp. SM1919]|uniref:RluA family pseudouridine synthase n=1 Tax=Paraferrimonas sp. SM1919 TaxID=2662263 RepID=UPI0013D6AA05|nr:RluA family pseudouridine synthase [Paraferrimonas sp. SM1919]